MAIAVTLLMTLLWSLLLFGSAVAQSELLVSDPRAVSQAQVLQVGTAQPAATPTGSARPMRSHTPKPLPEDMQRPIAIGLLITFVTVIGIIMFHRRQHPQR